MALEKSRMLDLMTQIISLQATYVRICIPKHGREAGEGNALVFLIVFE